MKRLLDEKDFEGRVVITLTDNGEELGETTFQMIGIREIDEVGNVTAQDIITGERTGFDDRELLYWPTFILERDEVEIFKKMIEHYQKVTLSGNVLAS